MKGAIRPIEFRNFCQCINCFKWFRPGHRSWETRRPPLYIPWGELQDNVSKPLDRELVPSSFERKTIRSWKLTDGVASLSNTKAWKSWAMESGIRSQLPNHQGRNKSHPFSNKALYRTSKLRVEAYMATVRRSWACGYRPRKKPAKLAPIAGAYFDVSAFDMRGFLSRKGWALSVRKFARSREKKRCSNRWKSSIRDKDRGSRKAGESRNGTFEKTLAEKNVRHILEITRDCFS